MQRKLFQNLSRIVGLRFAILREEVRLEKMRFIRAAWAIAIGFAFLQILLASILALGMELTEGSGTVWFLVILGTVSLLGFLVFLIASAKFFAAGEAPFATTTAEFKKDKECLESALRN